jgi:hypothetical protein
MVQPQIEDIVIKEPSKIRAVNWDSFLKAKKSVKRECLRRLLTLVDSPQSVLAPLEKGGNFFALYRNKNINPTYEGASLYFVSKEEAKRYASSYDRTLLPHPRRPHMMSICEDPILVSRVQEII